MNKRFIFIFVSQLLFIFFTACKNKSTESHYKGKIIDLHMHVAVKEENGHMSNQRMNRINDVLAFIQSSSIVKAGIITMANKGNIADTMARNDQIIAMSEQHSSLIPICSVHPMDGNASRVEMERLHQKGVRIIKLHPNSQHFDVATVEVNAIAHEAGKLGMILLFDSYNPFDANEIGKLIMLAVSNPDTKFIFAHMGFVDFEQFLTVEVLKKYPWYKNNIWMDLSAIAPELGTSPFREQLVWTIRKIGVEQFLFGSDFPIYDPKTAIEGLQAMGLTLQEEQQIFYTNACRLLQIQP
jgi:predicted TIM-barrel fold metal-dependent hydrolase